MYLHIFWVIGLHFIHLLSAPSPALPRLLLWKFGLGELMVHDLLAIRTAIKHTVYVRQCIRWCWPWDALG